jgi:phasin family protein
MVEPMQKPVDGFQEMGKDNYDAMVRSFSELNKGFQAIAATWAEFSKRSVEDATRAWEQMIAAKSLERAMEIQSNYAKNAYDSWMAEMLKIGEVYSSTARDAYKPAERVMEKRNA